MPTYQIFIDGNYWNNTKAASSDKAIERVKEQLKNLAPLNMSIEGIHKYRKRFEKVKITTKLQ